MHKPQTGVFPGLFFYAVLALIGVLDFFWIRGTNITIDETSLYKTLFFCAAAFLLGISARLLYRWLTEAVGPAATAFGGGALGRAVVFFEGLAFMTMGYAVLPLFNHLLVTVGRPYADLSMMQADRALGLDWNAYFFRYTNWRSWMTVSPYIYARMAAVSVAVFTALVATNRVLAAEFFIRAYFTSVTLAVAIGGLFPARGPVIMEQYRLGDVLKTLHRIPGVYFVPYIQRLHERRPFVMHMDDLPGVTFLPSFHTAAVLLLIYACRRTFMFWPVTLYALAMLASIPVEGGHYFIDMISGALLAAVVMIAFLLTPRYRGLFDKPAEPAAATP